MPNTNPQAVAVANTKLRVVMDRVGQLYNFAKALQAEFQAENWTALFPTAAGAGAELIVDGSETDGRAPMTNQDAVNAMNDVVGQFITLMEANVALGGVAAAANARRNLTLRLAVNPERY